MNERVGRNGILISICCCQIDQKQIYEYTISITVVMISDLRIGNYFYNFKDIHTIMHVQEKAHSTPRLQ